MTMYISYAVCTLTTAKFAPPVAVRLDGIASISYLGENVAPSRPRRIRVSTPHLGHILTALHLQVGETTTGDQTPTSREYSRKSRRAEIAELHDSAASATFGVTCHVSVVVTGVGVTCVVVVVVVICRLRTRYAIAV